MSANHQLFIMAGGSGDPWLRQQAPFINNFFLEERNDFEGFWRGASGGLTSTNPSWEGDISTYNREAGEIIRSEINLITTGQTELRGFINSVLWESSPLTPTSGWLESAAPTNVGGQYECQFTFISGNTTDTTIVNPATSWTSLSSSRALSIAAPVPVASTWNRNAIYLIEIRPTAMPSQILSFRINLVLFIPNA